VANGLAYMADLNGGLYILRFAGEPLVGKKAYLPLILRP